MNNTDKKYIFRQPVSVNVSKYNFQDELVLDAEIVGHSRNPHGNECIVQFKKKIDSIPSEYNNMAWIKDVDVTP